MWLTEEKILVWLHVLCMVYWLGGEWGVFNTSRFVTNPNIPMEERRRHMETAYRIDILARTGIILLLPLGLHMGYNLKVQPLGGPWIIGMWILVACWLTLLFTAYRHRDTDLGLRLTQIDEGIRFVLIPLLLGVGITSLINQAPLTARWYATKVTLYGLLLVIGLVLRYVMRHWTTLFRAIAEGTFRVQAELQLKKEIAMSSKLAYVYWAGIATVCFFGLTKPPF